MITLVYLSLLMAVTGVFAASVYGRSVPRSVSAMVYSYPRKLAWLWSAWLVAVAALLLPVMMERLDDRLCVFGFLPFTYMRRRLVLVSELCCAVSLYGTLLIC